MAKHHLIDGDGGSVGAVADDLLGLHATSNVTPYLSLFNRVRKFSPDDLTKELYERNGLSQIRAMRGTFFFVTRYLRPTMEAATRSSTDRINRTLDKAGIPYSEFQRLSKAIITSLSGGPKTLPEIKKDLSKTRLRTLDWRRVEGLHGARISAWSYSSFYSSISFSPSLNLWIGRISTGTATE